MPTIKDIARAAGVSHGTVSNVLNKTGKVSIEKMLLVEDAAKRLGYVPNAQAQLLRQGTPDLVAIFLPSLRDNAYLDLYTALQHSLQSFGYETSLYITGDIAGNEEKLLEDLPLSRVAALITVSCLRNDKASCYRDLPFPVVFVNRKVAEMQDTASFFTFDFYAAGYSLGRYVLEKSWSSIAFFSPPDYFEDAARVMNGLNDALENSAVSVQKFTSDTSLILNKAFDIVHGDRGFHAIITTSSERADALATAFKFSERETLPEVITLDSFRSFSNPHYKTFELDYSQMGARIADVLGTHLSRKAVLQENKIMACKGFPFNYPAIARSEGQVISMLTLGSPTVSALEKLVPQFKRLTGITLKITSMPYDDLYEHLGLLNSDFYYDLVRMDVVWLDSMGPQIYKPMQELGLDIDDLPQNLVASLLKSYPMAPGKLNCLPFDPSAQIFLYRTDLFTDATLCRAYYERFHEALTIPETIEQYLRVAEFFTREFNSDSPTQYGATSTCGMAVTAACDFQPFLLAKGSKLCCSPGKIKLDTPAMAEALCQYTQLFKYTSKQQHTWWQDSIRSFADGDTATATTFSNHAAYLINSKRSNVVGKTGAAVIPGGHPLLGGGVIGVSRFSMQDEACSQFFKWYYTGDVASAVVRLGGTSPLTNAYNDFENYLLFPWLSAARKSLELGIRGTGETSPQGFSIRQYEYILGTAVRNVINNVMTPQEAIINAQKIYNSQQT